MSSDAAAERRTRIRIRRFESLAEADRHDLEFWMQLSAADRVLLVWQLSEELWKWRGDQPDEPGLSRSVARVHRR